MPVTAMKNQSIANPGAASVGAFGFGGVMADLGYGGANDENPEEKKKREKALASVNAGAQDALGAQGAGAFGGAAMDLGYR